MQFTRALLSLLTAEAYSSDIMWARSLATGFDPTAVQWQGTCISWHDRPLDPMAVATLLSLGGVYANPYEIQQPWQSCIQNRHLSDIAAAGDVVFLRNVADSLVWAEELPAKTILSVSDPHWSPDDGTLYVDTIVATSEAAAAAVTREGYPVMVIPDGVCGLDYLPSGVNLRELLGVQRNQLLICCDVADREGPLGQAARDVQSSGNNIAVVFVDFTAGLCRIADLPEAAVVPPITFGEVLSAASLVLSSQLRGAQRLVAAAIMAGTPIIAPGYAAAVRGFGASSWVSRFLDYDPAVNSSIYASRVSRILLSTARDKELQAIRTQAGWVLSHYRMAADYLAICQQSSEVSPRLTSVVRPRVTPMTQAIPPTRQGKMRLVDQANIVGHKEHRSGWPYAVSALLPLVDARGILVDDFIERTFCYPSSPRTRYRDPWVGFFHHPPGKLAMAFARHSLEDLFSTQVWQDNQKSLVHAIALSEHLGGWLREVLGVPVTVLRHPTEVPDLKWSVDNYLADEHKGIFQFGAYLRNTRLIYQIPEVPGHLRFRSLPGQPWWADWDQSVKEYWESEGLREEYTSQVFELKHLPDDQYDAVLSRGVIVTEVFDASANNVVIECIARNTPLLINRYPSVVEYLGKDYPLYFATAADIPEMITPERMAAGSEYLSKLEKTWLDSSVFAAGVSNVLQVVAAGGI